MIEGDDNLLKHAIDYYSDLFGSTDEHNIHIDHTLWEELEQVSDEDNRLLIRPFSEIEIKEALFHMEKNKVAGPDKIPIEFHQTCWHIVKGDII
jgi:hypothetical protein